jgi:response regulator RpfG family c-di-GMP phosphodiesterase
MHDAIKGFTQAKYTAPLNNRDPKLTQLMKDARDPLNFIANNTPRTVGDLTMDRLHGLMFAESVILSYHHPYSYRHGQAAGNIARLVMNVAETDNFRMTDRIDENYRGKRLVDIVKPEHMAVAMEHHDDGKIRVPSSILDNPGKLSPEETAVTHTHPIHGAELSMLKMQRIYDIIRANGEQFTPEQWELLQLLGTVYNVQRFHHVFYNHKGSYPTEFNHRQVNYGQLNMPIESYLGKIIDVWDALRGVRVYRPFVVTKEASRRVIRGGAGTAFHPELSKLFLSVAENYTDELDKIMYEWHPEVVNYPERSN